MDQNTNAKAAASFILGITSVILMFFSYFIFTAIIGIVFSIIGIVLGVTARKEQASGIATAGLVLSIISLALTSIVLIFCVACLGVVTLTALT